jgi:uncharacterized membrane protein YozB (DUF420 family)
MALIGVVGGLTLVTIVALYFAIKLILSDEHDESTVLDVYRTFLLFLGIYLWWPGLARWARGVVETIGGVIP